MPSARLPGPGTPPGTLPIVRDRNGDVLVPGHLPVGQGRFVEYQGANGKLRRPKVGLNEVPKGARRNGAQQRLVEHSSDASPIRSSREEGGHNKSQLLERNRFSNAREDRVAVEKLRLVEIGRAHV